MDHGRYSVAGYRHEDERPMLYLASAEPALLDRLVRLLPHRFAPSVYASAAALLAGIERDRPGCALIDSALPHPQGIIDLLERLRRLAPEVVVLMSTEPGDVATAVDVLRAGAFDLFERSVADVVLRQRVIEILAAMADA